MSHRDPIKVYDARWEDGEFSDAQIARLFESAVAYGRELGADTVVVTRDARLAARRVMEAAIDEALRQGMRVFMRPEPISTPQSYFTCMYVSQEHPGTMGLTITASHNPPGDIGVKFTVPGVRAVGLDCGPAGGLSRIREIYHSPQRYAARGGGRLHVLDLTRQYVEWSLRQAQVADGSLAGMKVVLDAMHGSAGPEFMLALERAGAEVRALRYIPDGTFPDGAPNPTSAGRMDRAVSLAGAVGAEAMIGLDGDGDRIVFGDGRGMLTAGFAFVAILSSMKPGTDGPVPVLYDPKVSPPALVEWARMNTRPMLFRNGHSQIKDYMLRQGAAAGAEESGHYYHRLTLGTVTACAENSLLTVLLFLKALRSTPGLRERLWELQGRVLTTGEFNYRFESDCVRDEALAALVAKFAGEGAATATRTPDGIDLQGTCISRGVSLRQGDVSLSDDWYSGYVRIATNERGIVRSYFSAGERATLERVEKTARCVLENDFRGQRVA